MPELPEVETIKRQLEKAIKGQKIEKVRVLRKQSFFGVPKQVLGREIIGFDRKAKYLIIELDGSPKLNLLIHLKMTGQMVYDPDAVSGRVIRRIVGGHPTADWVKKLPSKHTRVIFALTKGTLYFNDLRVFGWIKVMGATELKQLKDQLPPDVVDKSFTNHYLQKILSSSRRSVKMIIMDQTKLGGVGNIYANDALYCAGLNPRLSGMTLIKNEARVNKLFICLKRVIGQGIRFGGASDSNYVHLNGLGGKYQERFLIYKQQGKPCRKCGAKIKKTKLGGRGTYFCPQCQK